MLRSSSALVAAVVLLAAPSAHALSCASDSLERKYRAAAYVFTAEILDVEGIGASMVAIISITEFFKGQPVFEHVNFDEHTETWGPRLEPGTEYLFFLRSDRVIRPCTSVRPLRTDRGDQLSETLTLLREYSGGRTPSLSGIWRFRGGVSCSLSTAFELPEGFRHRSGLRLTYRRDAEGGRDEASASLAVAVVIRGPENRAVALVDAGGVPREFEYADFHGGMGDFVLRGEEVIAFARELQSSDGVYVDVTVQHRYGTQTWNGRADVTNGRDAIQQFVSCVDTRP